MQSKVEKLKYIYIERPESRWTEVVYVCDRSSFITNLYSICPKFKLAVQIKKSAKKAVSAWRIIRPLMTI